MGSQPFVLACETEGALGYRLKYLLLGSLGSDLVEGGEAQVSALGWFGFATAPEVRATILVASSGPPSSAVPIAARARAIGAPAGDEGLGFAMGDGRGVDIEVGVHAMVRPPLGIDAEHSGYRVGEVVDLLRIGEGLLGRVARGETHPGSRCIGPQGEDHSAQEESDADASERIRGSNGRMEGHCFSSLCSPFM